MLQRETRILCGIVFAEIPNAIHNFGAMPSHSEIFDSVIWMKLELDVLFAAHA